MSSKYVNPYISYITLNYIRTSATHIILSTVENVSSGEILKEENIIAEVQVQDSDFEIDAPYDIDGDSQMRTPKLSDVQCARSGKFASMAIVQKGSPDVTVGSKTYDTKLLAVFESGQKRDLAKGDVVNVPVETLYITKPV